MSEISVRISTMSERESSYVKTDESSVLMSSPPIDDSPQTFSFPVPTQKPDVEIKPSQRYRQLQPLTLMDEASQAVGKFVDSDSSDASARSPRNQQEYQQESDDTSYAKAIQNAQRRKSMINGLSSSAEEDTDKQEPGMYSEGLFSIFCIFCNKNSNLLHHHKKIS